MISHPQVWKRRQDYSEQFMLSGHYYGFWGRDLTGYYPGLGGKDVYPIFIRDKFVDINYKEDLKLAEALQHEK